MIEEIITIQEQVLTILFFSLLGLILCLSFAGIIYFVILLINQTPDDESFALLYKGKAISLFKTKDDAKLFLKNNELFRGDSEIRKMKHTEYLKTITERFD